MFVLLLQLTVRLFFFFIGWGIFVCRPMGNSGYHFHLLNIEAFIYTGIVSAIMTIWGINIAIREIKNELPKQIAILAKDLFLNSPYQVKDELERLDKQENKKGMYKFVSLYCNNSVWKSALRELTENKDLILMDLRGFSSENMGCTYELAWLHRSFDLNKLVFLIDDKTDLNPIRDSIISARKFAYEESFEINDWPKITTLKVNGINDDAIPIANFLSSKFNSS